MGELIPKFIGFIVSFFVIAIYWVVHHRTFGFVINYNPRLLWLNLFFLLAVVLMPFSSGFYSEYVTKQLILPMIVYLCNILFLGIMSLIIWNYIANPKNKLSEGVTKEMTKYFRFRAVIPPFAFILTATVYLFIDRQIAVYIPILIPVLLRVIKMIYFKPKPQLKSK
jgi:uncharacterized membrane protein